MGVRNESEPRPKWPGIPTTASSLAESILAGQGGGAQFLDPSGVRPDARRARVQASKCWSQAMDGILGTDRQVSVARPRSRVA